MFAFRHLLNFIVRIDPEDKASVVDLLEDRVGSHSHSKGRAARCLTFTSVPRLI